jgi:hypothetical protein
MKITKDLPFLNKLNNKSNNSLIVFKPSLMTIKNNFRFYLLTKGRFK